MPANEWRMVPTDPSFAQIAKLAELWCCSMDEASEGYTEILDLMSVAPPAPADDRQASAWKVYPKVGKPYFTESKELADDERHHGRHVFPLFGAAPAEL